MPFRNSTRLDTGATTRAKKPAIVAAISRAISVVWVSPVSSVRKPLRNLLILFHKVIPLYKRFPSPIYAE